MNKKIKLELLAPAKNLETGIQAINAGADAVYIGAPKFGARFAAGNSLVDIEKLVEHAHQFRVKVYVVLNTIVYDEELEEVEEMIQELYNMGADAIIIQDMGILEMKLPPIAIFASTQTHNYDLEKIKFLEGVGIKRIILARECSLEKIKEIKSNTNVELEFFVHGALCVSFSGQCYFSEAMCGRSANRGQCAQPCRLPYNLVDVNNKVIVKNKYLLSLKDLNLSDSLEELVDAGITSFKIEGRLKDTDYVINNVAFYRQKLDQIITNNPKFEKASAGEIKFNFKPNPEKTFNRGFTDYFLHGKDGDITSFDTPKSRGKFVGFVEAVRGHSFFLDRNIELHNGDGICYFNEENVLCGTNINRVVGNRVFPNEIGEIKPGTRLYRNFDFEFDKVLKNKPTERKVLVDFIFLETKKGFALQAKDEEGNVAVYEEEVEKQLAKNTEYSSKIIKEQLEKLGNTYFVLRDLKIELSKSYFISVSQVNNFRRCAVELLEEEQKKNYRRKEFKIISDDSQYPEKELSYLSNVANKKARKFYKKHGVEKIEDAFEFLENKDDVVLMTTKHCLKYELGICPKYKKESRISGNYQEPFYLENSGNKYKLEFDCLNCEMRILSARG